MICTGHQINFLPGCSVLAKVAAADAVIWCDRMQYERHGFVNRNRLETDEWMIVPVNEHDTFAPINEVRVADQRGRKMEKIARTLEMRIGERAFPYAFEVRRRLPMLVGLNWRLLSLLLTDLGIRTEAYFQSHVDIGHIPVRIVSEEETELTPARERIAEMVHAIGGTVWLSGPSGRRYLDEEPFRARGIMVDYFSYDGPNPSSIELLRPSSAAYSHWQQHGLFPS